MIKNTAANLLAKVPSPKGCGCQERKEKLVTELRKGAPVLEALKEAFKR